MDAPRHIATFSGGKDSAAMILRMLELKMPIDMILFADCGLELPETYEFVKKFERYINIPITVAKKENLNFDDIFYQIRPEGKRKGQIRGFPFVINPGCYISKILKIEPMQKLKKRGDFVYLGISYDEKHREQKPDQRKEKGILKYPLIEWKWTQQMCYDYCKKHGMLNPVYKYFDRNGCWCCPKQTRRSLFMLHKRYPLLWEKLKKYEKDSPHGFKPDFSLEKFEWLIKNNKTRFKMEGKLKR